MDEGKLDRGLARICRRRTNGPVLSIPVQAGGREFLFRQEMAFRSKQVDTCGNKRCYTQINRRIRHGSCLFLLIA